MNRIEEAIQKAKLARAREAAPAGHRDGDVAAVGPRPVPVHAVGAADLGTPTGEASRGAEARGSGEIRIGATIPGRSLVVDHESLRREGIMPEAADAHRLADEFRVAKRAILAQMGRTKSVGTGRRVVTVASALPGEGKTFSSFHLAMSFAMERDLNVLLIDGDVARPTLSRALGCGSCPGLLEFLEGSVGTVDETLYRTDVERLWFLPAGAPTRNAAELLTSPRMPVLLDALAQRIGHLVIVMDTPPLLPTVESRALTDLSDQTLLVVKANSTPQGAILQALEQVGHGRSVQLLLNQRRESKLDQYYYYQYPSYPPMDATPAARAD
jgi:receptor protein-tyrosine kinase